MSVVPPRSRSPRSRHPRSPLGRSPLGRAGGWRSRAGVRLGLAAVVTGVLLAGAQPAGADIGEQIILRCTHNESLSGFSQSDYRKALSELNPDTEEYSDCASRIRQAQLAAAGGALTSAGPGSAANPVPLPATAAEQQAITRAQQVAPTALTLDGRVIHPGVVHVNVASALSKLPSPLLATLAFLLACLLLIGGRAARNRLRGHTD